MPFSQDLYVRALHFAARAHGAQQTPTHFPYVVHLSSVCAEVIWALEQEKTRDGHLAVPCALLHDVLEDTSTGPAAIEERFGPRVLAGVQALTKDRSVDKGQRMRHSLDRILKQPPEIAMVKMADRITNLGPPPSSWTAEKKEAYRDEARMILDTLSSASAVLAARLRDRIERYPPLEL